MSDNFPSVTDSEINGELNKALEYIEWLSNNMGEESRKGNTDLFKSLKKDIIINFGGILECMVFYICVEGVRLKKLCFDVEDNSLHSIGTIPKTDGYIAHVTKVSRERKIQLIDFKELINHLYTNSIINETTKENLHFARELRNGVHLSKKLLHSIDFESLNVQSDYLPKYTNALEGLRLGLIQIQT